ncbi:hypothetical protein EK21DRAFT_107100 [Setomelanomma holmii]|uniref:BTB domain-containing protein n=1 Tax=Setomelanomma holmii TaxID=210430 RepID=A0A9P4LUB6_9PLEO|nr:hypothetical protein EK21DRAFT_107100 [Setomelanomma holmii]
MTTIPTTTSESPNSPTLNDAVTEGIVAIQVVQDDPKKYYIHEALLVHHSEYFRKALSGLWKEATEKYFTLTDVEHTVFNIFVHWLYKQIFPAVEDSPTWSDIIGVDPDEHGVQDILRLKYEAYSFRDRFLIPASRRGTAKTIVEHIQEYGLSCWEISEIVDWAWENIPPNRPVLQLLVGKFCDNWEVTEDD